MASTGVNVLRWSALGAGALYGFYHQAKLSTAAKLAAVDREYKHKESLIQQAKAEFRKKNAPASSGSSDNGGVVRDPDASNFDLEAYLNAISAEQS